MKIHLISYGDDNYTAQRENFKNSAVDSEFFDEIDVFGTKDLGNQFSTQFKDVLQLVRGGGYWIWKPYLIKKAMDKIEENDILIYCDAGCTVNSGGKERFNQYIEQLISSETGIISFQLDFKAYLYTKQEVFDYFNATDDIVNADLVCAGIVLYKKCAHAVMVIDKWLKAVYDDPWLFTDKLSAIPRHKQFIENRHDQSVYSIIINTYGADKIPDETYFNDFKIEGARFPFWATRLR